MRLGEFAKKFGVGIETVRYYQREGLLSIPGRFGTFRKYGAKECKQMSFIRLAKEYGFPLSDIQFMMKTVNSNFSKSSTDNFSLTLQDKKQFKQLLHRRAEIIATEKEKIEKKMNLVRSLILSCNQCGECEKLESTCKMFDGFSIEELENAGL